jgi:PERQ amino acid-rich with GYF domain-containing protein
MRKISVSHVNSPGAFGVSSPGGARPGPRRRETQEAYPFPSSSQLNSPSVTKTARVDSRPNSPPPSLTRRRTDFKDTGDSSDEKPPAEVTDGARAPFSGLKRTATGPLNTAVAGGSSPWSATPQSAGFSPMGAFGNFAINSNATVGTPTADKRPGLAGGRAESRFKGLMAKDSDETKSSQANPGGLESIPHDEQHEQHATGSAALGGGQDISPPRSRGFGTPSRQDSRDDFGHGAFGMTSDPFRTLMGQQHDQSHARSQQQAPAANDAMSPADTNPYQSPEHAPADLDDADDDESDLQNAHLPNLGGIMNDSMSSGAGAFHGLGNLGRVPAAPPSDRSQTSSVGPNRGFGGFSGLGALPGLGGASAWGGPQASIGTPIRDRAAIAGNFGDNPFGSSADLGSPSLAALSGLGAFGAHPGQSRGGSRLGSLFPSVQEQMRPEHGRQEDEEVSSAEFANLPRDTSSPFRRPAEVSGAFPDSEMSQQEPIGQRSAQASAPMQAQAVSSSASNQPPPSQQKTMVMPDRMRWIYRDPQGVTQGPWSGLEMHDWYKAGFFSPELLVKKYEDPEYEPLAQLIRRIGNSREPFLVPQIGIPHGNPTIPQPPANWTNPLSSGGAQPPFANSFPSFGTTLTADQQNALERRKQEEQYLMARQKEHLAQQQFAQRFQAQTGQLLFPQLHHQSSVQSLHSQQSFGSLSSPAPPFPPAPLSNAFSGTTAVGSSHVPGFFDNSFRSAGPLGGLGAIGAGVDALGNIREEDASGMVNRLNLGRSTQGNFGGIGQPFPQAEEQRRISTMLDDRSRLEQQQAQHDASHRFQQDQPARNEQFEQFQGLQEHARADPFGVGSEGVIGKPVAPPSEQQQIQQDLLQAQSPDQTQSEYDAQYDEEIEALTRHEEAVAATPSRQEPSLTEQVQKAASSVKQSPAPASSPWAKVDTSLPQPFPPAPSQSPLPAPAAQRNRSHVADALHAESRSRSQTPSAETPSASVAPWAKEPAESSRGPSLKEIQEAEAKVAAEAEALAAEVRRVAFERELAQVQIATAPAPGLPTTSNWASSATASPAIGVAPSPWAKAAKTVAAPATAKSMAQIQKEEEARKKRLAAAAVTQAAVAAAVGVAAVQQAAGGKRYADLASKVASTSTPASPIPGIGGAWTTVGASGKVKTPLPAPTPVGTRVASASVLPTVAAVKKTVPSRATAGPMAVNAIDEFKKWAVNELKHDLNKSVTADEFVNNLLSFPSELEIVTEAVHSVSHTIDSRHFAEEFIRRRKLADKGLVDTTKPASPAAVSQGGWNEVAKKNAASVPKPQQEVKEDLSFKVVPNKKKGGKK